MTELARRLGVGDAVVLGLGSMLGAGVFVVFAPATAAAGGTGVLIALAVAGFVAYCNATSSARLAARYPESGGTYVYGRERIGPFAGFLAGWGFVAGKTASCAAMALTIGAYLAPGFARYVALAAVLAMTLANLLGITKTAGVTRWLVTLTLLVLALVTVVGIVALARNGAGTGGAGTGGAGTGGVSGLAHGFGPVRPAGVLTAAGLLFFAFAGYARVATLGEEVRDPEHSIPRAISLALGVVLVVYAVVGTVTLAVLGPARLAAATAPLATLVGVAGAPWLAWVVRVGAGAAVAGVLLTLLAGVARTALAMARRRDLPGGLAAVHPTRHVPYRAQLAIGLAVAVLAAVGDIRSVVGFSSCTVLVYYAVANASALTLGRERGRWLPVQTLAGCGLVGCVVLALALPWQSVLAGLGVLALGSLGRAIASVRTIRASPH